MATISKNNNLNAQHALKIVSYNMHGFNQGFATIKDFIETLSSSPDIFMLQEHWLTPTNLCKFNEMFPDYYGFGISALTSKVESGPLVGRPYGGVITLVKTELLSVAECIQTAERFTIVRVSDILFINVYLPCVGTVDRDLILNDILAEISSYKQKFDYCGCILAGDFNCDLDKNNSVAIELNRFLVDNNFSRCDLLNPCATPYTFIDASMSHYSKIDYILYDSVKVSKYDVIESTTNLSDHLPVIVTCDCSFDVTKVTCKNSNNDSVAHLRWDHADLIGYYNATMCYLQEIRTEIYEFEANDVNTTNDVNMFIDNVYRKIVFALETSALAYVPQRKVNFYKFWWSQELDCLKEKAIESDQLWKASGRPRSGPIFNKRNVDKRAYKTGIHKNQSDSVLCYSNELHDALLAKNGNAFWKCWKAKFEPKASKCKQVEGQTDHQIIAHKFKCHFENLGSAAAAAGSGAHRLHDTYDNLRPCYAGSPLLERYAVDAELVERIIVDLKRGKAAGLDSLTAEHLQNCHALLPCVLSKLFNLMVAYGYVPNDFGRSYTVPLQKGDKVCSKSLKVDDFRGISISPVISKVFEHCILNRYGGFFSTADNQFGFKKATGCSHAIYTARAVIGHYVAGGSTVNLCALDLSKAFDRMSHRGLFVKLMQRHIPERLLALFEHWFDNCYTCVKWFTVYSLFFKLETGIRQGGVLSPQFFALYIDDIIHVVSSQGVGCFMHHACLSIILYADDILLLTPSVWALQKLLSICEYELHLLGMSLNVNKTVCMRIGPHFQNKCVNIVTASGRKLEWVDELRYLGVFLVSSSKFKCTFSYAKRSFYRCFNAVYGRIGRAASEEVILSLVKSKCIPVLLYGLDVCPLNATETRSLNYTVNRILMKIFATYDSAIIEQCQTYFNFSPVDQLVHCRKSRFLRKYSASENSLCILCADVANEELCGL